MAAALGMTTIVIDGSQFYFLRRRQQGMTDLAALAAAGNLGAARQAATASLAGNGIPASAIQTVELGTYTPDPAVPTGQRFVPAGANTTAGANAARVTVRSAPKGFFAAVMAAQGVTITTRATAASASVATFAVNPPMPGLDPTIANGVLGGLIGSAISLTTADYLGLGSALVDPFALANAVAARTGFSGTYGDLGRTSVRLSDMLAALADVLSGASAPPIAVSATRVLAAATSFAGPRLTFGNLIAFDGYLTRTVGSLSGLSSKLPVLPLITAAARLTSATIGNKITVPLTSLASGLSAAKFVLATNIPASKSTFAAIGPTGTTVRTLETRAAMSFSLPGIPGVASISLSLYFQSQAATARLAALTGTGGGQASATLGIIPGVSTAWIGSVSDTALTNWTVTPQPGPAPLVDTLLLKVSGSAQSITGSNAETLVTFSPDDVAACRMKVLPGDGMLTPLTSLLSSLQFQVSILGFGFGTQSSIISSVSTVLQSGLQPVASTVNSTMSFLGLNLGNVGSYVCAVRYGQPALVN